MAATTASPSVHGINSRKRRARRSFRPARTSPIPRLSELVRLSDADFRALFSGSPIKRLGHQRFLRNVLIAIGNSADPGLAPLALEQLSSPSPLVRGAAVWALARLTPQGDFDALARSRLADESEPGVLAELAKETQSAKK